MSTNDAPNLATARRARAVVISALWAAAGDALGWITEGVGGLGGVIDRTGKPFVTEPTEWTRIVGGRGGPRVTLPAGTYSDDTQLRLAVCRSIRGDGVFDAETFAKIEMTVWPSYALGGGLGTEAAAANLARRNVNWFSNFFDNGEQTYVKGGANGAAMRVQPHVWSAPGLTRRMLLDVLRNALVTHGHAQGFCGAIFHAGVLADTLASFEVPEPRSWHRYIDLFRDIPDLIESDPELSAFWRPMWEKATGGSLHDAIEQTVADAYADLERVQLELEGTGAKAYSRVLDGLGVLSRRLRGAGLKTSIAALALAYMHQDSDVEDALILAANELNCDTDTIATMAGALLGATAERLPDWPIQDRAYVTQEAERLAAIAEGKAGNGFEYPDIGVWTPPAAQDAAVLKRGQGLAMAGLGPIRPIGQEYRSGEAIWQWYALTFGQTVLVTRQVEIAGELSPAQLPGRH